MEGQLGVLGGQQHLVVDLVHEPAGDLLQDAEVEHEERLGVHRALDRHADAIVVAVQRLTLVPAKVMKCAEANTR